MKPGRPPVWFLIDGTNAVHRDAYGAGITRAAETLEKRLVMMQKQWEPSCVITVWDADVPTFRHELLPGYKAGRKRLDGIDDAIAACKEACRRQNIATMDAPGYEADDLLATLSREAREAGYNVVIYSGDKDLHQLIRAGEVSQLISVSRKFGKLDCGWITEDMLKAKYGVTAAQWVEYKMLVGDPSDKIDGVRNIGPEVARQVLNDCGSLDAFYKNPFAAGISPSKRAALMNAKSQMPLLRELCTLRSDVPLPELWKEGV